MTSDASEKLQKVLARSGLGSRREMERVIAEGRVKVNGRVAKLGDRVELTQKIEVDGHLIEADGKQQGVRVIVYHKPEGEICSRKDPEGRRTVYDRLPRLNRQRWVAVGRLDINTSGLLLFTTDGELANKLMHPSSNIDREYRCRIFGNVEAEMLERLKNGVQLDDGVAAFSDIVKDEEGGGLNQWYTVCLMEGRNREVRRLWESQSLHVNRLKRVRYGPVFLPSHVRQGKSVPLEQSEIKLLYQTVGMPVPQIHKPDQKEKQALERAEKRMRAGGSFTKANSKAKSSRNKTV